MAMTGMRTATGALGVLEESPPDAIVNQTPIWPIRAIPARALPVAKELAHWAYGALGGVAYVNAPERFLRYRWSGPVYGMIVWSGFEFGVAPLMQLSQARRLRLLDRSALALDHILYGAIVAGSRWPHQV